MTVVAIATDGRCDGKMDVDDDPPERALAYAAQEVHVTLTPVADVPFLRLSADHRDAAYDYDDADWPEFAPGTTVVTTDEDAWTTLFVRNATLVDDDGSEALVLKLLSNSSLAQVRVCVCACVRVCVGGWVGVL